VGFTIKINQLIVIVGSVIIRNSLVNMHSCFICIYFGDFADVNDIKLLDNLGLK